jgi:hypothetical protein
VTAVAVVLIVISAIVVFAIAAAVIGREARRLDAVAPRAVYVFDDAVAYVADHVPVVSQAHLTHDDVAQILRIHMNLLWERGLAPEGVTDRPQDIVTPTVVEDVDIVGHVIGAVEEEGLAIDDVDVAAAVAAHLAYFDEIGAVGPIAAGPTSTGPPATRPEKTDLPPDGNL